MWVLPVPAPTRRVDFSRGQAHSVHALVVRIHGDRQLGQGDAPLRAPEDHPPSALRDAVLRRLQHFEADLVAAAAGRESAGK